MMKFFCFFFVSYGRNWESFDGWRWPFHENRAPIGWDGGSMAINRCDVILCFIGRGKRKLNETRAISSESDRSIVIADFSFDSNSIKVFFLVPDLTQHRLCGPPLFFRKKREISFFFCLRFFGEFKEEEEEEEKEEEEEREKEKWREMDGTEEFFGRRLRWWWGRWP